MKGSSQGPKDKVLHASNYGASGNEYITCGEKHALVWKLANDTPKSEAIKLGGDKNKIYLCAQRMGEVGILATAEGDLMIIKGIEVGAKKSEAHGKNSINALWGNEKGDVLISGGKDGVIKVWGLGIILSFASSSLSSSSSSSSLLLTSSFRQRANMLLLLQH